MRYTRMLARLVVVTLGLLTSVTSAHGALPAVPPEILAQLKSMSPSEQRAMASQYGFTLDQVLGVAESEDFVERPALGAPGEPLEQVELGDIDGAENREEFLAGEAAEELQRFGSNLFDSEVSTFAPVDNIPVPEGYRLGVGDELRVMLIGKEQGDFPLLIDRDGSVTLPKLGRIVLSGLTFPEAKKLIEKRVSEQLIGSEAVLSMGSLRSISVFIAGEVKKPGSYSVSALSTLSQAVYVAGGISEAGSFRKVQLKRQGETVGVFDIYDLLLFGNNSNDKRLQNGDVIFVPVAGPQASVSGRIVRPAIYELTSGETIGDLVNMAGGLLATANLKQVLLKRYEAEAPLPTVYNLNFNDPETLSARAIDGDELSVSGLSERVSNPLVIEGNTRLAGLMAWSEGLKISDIFDDLDADFEPTTDFGLALIARRKNKLNDIEVFSFSLADAILDPSSEDNIVLQPFDRVVILPQPSLSGSESRRDLIDPYVTKLQEQTGSDRRAQVVTIAGAVRVPGVYPLLDEGNISTAITLAGGYSDSAYLDRAEIGRSVLAGGDAADVKILRVNLTQKSDKLIRLIGRDKLTIKTIDRWASEKTVELSGELVFPGTYTIYDGETVGGLIERAGGLTGDAFLEGAQFFSASAREFQSRQLRKIRSNIRRDMSNRVNVGQSESAPPEELIDEELLGRVVIDLEQIMASDNGADPFVDDGDTLFVPKFTNSVTVVGEVYEPGSFLFEDGLSVNQYVELAGGTTTYSRRKNIYVLKADGSVRFLKSQGLKTLLEFDTDVMSRVEPGDVVVVPTNLDYQPPIARINSITNVVFQSLTSIAAFFSIANQ